ncbi:MAG: Kazal-type serine protease inhibitor domain-containing protein [Polyangiales bacterium]
MCDCNGTGYEGLRCELDVDECSTDPCLNGGTCENTPGSFTCDCAEGFDGPRCEDAVGCLDCGAGTFCNYPIGSGCGASDPGVGECLSVPEVCPDIEMPVCGCDGRTYMNPCFAAQNSVSVRNTGACDGREEDGCTYRGQFYDVGETFPAGDGCNTCSCRAGGVVTCSQITCNPAATCGGLADQGCPSGQYCRYAPNDACGDNNEFGTCATMPFACAIPLDPTCGCDGRTYDSPCHAAMAGISVAADGPCTVTPRPQP